MLNKPRRIWLPATIAIAFLAVAVLGVVTYRNTIAIRQGERRVIKSYAVREAAHRLLSSLKDMETGERGYLITGKTVYLDPYRSGRESLKEGFERLRMLTDGNASQQAHLDHLEKVIDQKQEILAETIALHSRQAAALPVEETMGKEVISQEVIALVKSDKGKLSMDQARQSVEQIIKEEDLQLEQHELNSEALASLSRTSVAAGNMIALSLISAVAVIAYVDRRRRDQAESTLQAKQTELSAIVDSARDGIVTFSDDLQVRLMNPAAAAMHRTEIQRATGRCMLEFVPERMRENVRQEIQSFLASDKQSHEFSDGRAMRSNGSEFPVSGVLTKTRIQDDRVNTLMFRDLSEERANQARERQLSAVLGQVRDAIVLCDLDGRILSWNQGAASMYGKGQAETLHRNVREILFANRRQAWEHGQETLSVHGAFSQEFQQVGSDGREMTIESRTSLIHDEAGQPNGQLIINMDVTERKQEEARERRSQRLESIGTLAGGVAHDLNNVLTPILMSAKLVARGSNNSQRLLETIVISAERGGRMIKKLLAFAGGEKSGRQLVSLRDVVLEAQEILSHTLPKTIDLKVAAPEKLAPVMGDATELSQVLMNLAINARDAMPEGGRLEIEASNFNIHPTRSKRNDVLQAGPHVLLTVADTGEGIRAEILDRIFDPFFTTKAHGKGTGLGLATSLGIVRAHGGDLNVCSEYGAGTTFSIYLPAGQRSAEAVVERPGEEDVARGQGETVLIIDDEPLIVETARETLQSGGYRVLSAADGTAGIDIYHHQADEIDIVLLDMMMPGLDGFDVKSVLRAIRPTARIVASSGLRRPGQDGDRLADVNGFLAKPYSDSQLLHAVRKTLDDNP